MKYIAEPYVALVDQLLTGLTGGQTREEHPFFPSTQDYGLSRSFAQVNAATIKVLGQSQDKFTVFVPGKDWTYTTKGRIMFQADKDNSLLPAADAIWPDEGTEFFVSYYHQDSKKALLTDRNVGSLTRTLAESFCRELAVLEKQLEKVYDSGFVDTAKGTSLDQVVALLGLTRKGGDYAGGTVRFYRDSAAPGDIYIPANTRLSTPLNPPVSFVTVSDRTLRKGQLAVEADIRSEVTGAKGVVTAGTVSIINKAIHGITAVINDSPTVFSGSRESDDELRLRAKSVMERAGRATPGAIVNMVTSQTGLKENEIKLVEDFTAHPGKVSLFIAREPDAGLATKVDKALLDSRPAGIRFEHNLKSAVDVDESIPVSNEALREDGPGGFPLLSSVADGDFRLPVKCRVRVYPRNTRLSADEESRIKQSISNKVFNIVDEAAIGSPVIFNRMVANVMDIEGIQDIILDLYPTDDATGKGRKNLIVPEGQRAVFIDRTTDIEILFVGAPVYFDFRLALVLKGTSQLSEAELEIKRQLVDLFSTAPSTINSTALLTALQPSDLFTLAPADQHWSVEYDQAGLVIRELDETVTLSSGEQAVLRKITVEEKS